MNQNEEGRQGELVKMTEKVTQTDNPHNPDIALPFAKGGCLHDLLRRRQGLFFRGGVRHQHHDNRQDP